MRVYFGAALTLHCLESYDTNDFPAVGEIETVAPGLPFTEKMMSAPPPPEI